MQIGEAIPVLAIVGTEDVMTPPRYSTFLEETMSNASVHIVEGGTHFVFAEYPDDVNKAIERFVGELASS
ncbi:MAG: alpha/beta hydrolase [Myxococcota bacterium]|jgi:pimeloyl-ACP methyl ester carboxylesterase|nr:alpha/beta hydrolase [Myxococcota bacterium]